MFLQIQIGEYILLISFSLIYLIFLCYDLFKRGERYGSFAYIAALLPTNYLWYLLCKHGLLIFGPIGAQLVLCVLWLAAVIRDILIKDRAKGYKDADDVALYLIIGIVINLILAAVLPALPGLAVMKDGTTAFLKFFYVPIYDPVYAGAAASGVILAFKILATTLTVSVIIPVVLDLKNMSVAIWALILITVIFAIPFAFLAYLWAPAVEMIWVILLLFSILFFVFLLIITKGKNQK